MVISKELDEVFDKYQARIDGFTGLCELLVKYEKELKSCVPDFHTEADKVVGVVLEKIIKTKGMN